MRKPFAINGKKVVLAATAAALSLNVPLYATGNPAADEKTRITSVYQINPTAVEMKTETGVRITLDFYGENIVRVFRDNAGGMIRDPKATPEAKILVATPRKPIVGLNVKENGNTYTVTTASMEITIDKSSGQMKAKNLANGKIAFEEIAPVEFKKGKTTITLKAEPDAYFYGGGVQNGRFSHKGKVIAIENQNSWTDGGVASPSPNYWSTEGYGFMWHTFKKGKYDFCATEPGKVTLMHETDYLDVFFMVNEEPTALLNDFFQLTGNPVLLPKFGFYEGHLNAYNRDYWKESTDGSGVPFEDGKRYRESQNDNGGTKESLNGEKNNYQFSARAVIDRYRAADMPLGWILPNDGYGAGYGQTSTLDGNIQNLKEFGDYARKNGVEIGLWTESNLHPKEGVSALLQRDLIKEVRDAGVRVLKTDVAWVGAGYSFGLNGVTDAAHIMPYYGNNCRPFIISLDGWAGTQRYATIWTGDQSGGEWEYIRFHIPTYIGSGLSGQPNITSDMDGIFGGKNMQVNIRDFQWKTFTPMQLNMDGWGANEKYPQALGEPATSINRTYLKIKSEIMPYAYSIAYEAIDGKPMIRAMFLEEENPYTLGTSTQYQFMYGPYMLVAPIYQPTAMDKFGNDVRNGIYLPEGTWIDYFTGEKFNGGRILNNVDAPIWKLPVYIKQGAIIPMNEPHNNVAEIDKSVRIYELYPGGKTSFTEYDDDGKSELYRNGQFTTTLIEQSCDEKQNVTVTVNPTKGNFDGFVKEKKTIFKINTTKAPKKLTAKVGKKSIKLVEVATLEEFEKGENCYFYYAAPELNRFSTPGCEYESFSLKKNPQVWVKIAASDVTASATTLTFKGYEYNPIDKLHRSEGALAAPAIAVKEENREAYTITPTWEKVQNADYYEIMFGDMLYSTITEEKLLFEDLQALTDYTFRIRAVNKSGASEWAEIKTKTKSNPLEFALKGITAETTAENQGGQGTNRIFDFEEGNVWHTKYSTKAVPFDMIIDLHSVNTLDKFHYLPRLDTGNGTILEGSVSYSEDKSNWSTPVAFTWKRDPEVKVFTFTGKPVARYIKISVTKALGDYGSGRELYVFKVPGTESYIPGDINNDKKIDENDLTSYMNYTGLRKSDSDFDYISKGDINKNGLIDAFDISAVATCLNDGVNGYNDGKIGGAITLAADKKNYKAGETVEISVKGENLTGVNALSFSLPYSTNDYEYVEIQFPAAEESMGIEKMENLSKNRLHTNGTTALYPTFVNLGEKAKVNGSGTLFKIVMKAKRNVKFELKATDGIIADKFLNTVSF